MKKYHFLGFVFFYLFAIFCAQAESTLIPILKQRINDLTHTLTVQQLDNLEQQVIQFENHHPDGSQIAILIVPRLSKSTTIEEQANRIFNYWQLGQKGKDNGILLLIALYDRELRIEVGYGLEGQLTDLKAKRIIDLFLIPNFKNKNYYQGISQAINAIDSVITDPVNNILQDEEKKEQIYDDLIIFASIAALIIAILFLVFHMIKPSKFIKDWAKILFLLLTISSLLMFAYIVFNYHFSLTAQIKAWAFFTVFCFLFSIMMLFGFSILQLCVILPTLNLAINLVVSKRINKKGKIKKVEIKIYSKTAAISSIILITVFSLLSPILQFFVALIWFISIFIYLIIHGKSGSGNGSSGGKHGGGRSSGGGFSGGGGRSGGGGSSGRW